MRSGQPIQFPILPNHIREARHAAIQDAENAAVAFLQRNTILPRSQAPVIQQTSNPAIPKLPQHIVNAYIESLVAKEEVCPVTFNTLLQQSTYIIGCGHAISEEAIKWIETEHSCPVCRSVCSLDILQQWKE
jgi:hypothetical protein